jgi:hypothetical protein
VTGAVDDGLKEVWVDSPNEIEGGRGASGRHKVWVIKPGMGQMGMSPNRGNIYRRHLTAHYALGDRYYI